MLSVEKAWWSRASACQAFDMLVNINLYSSIPEILRQIISESIN